MNDELIYNVSRPDLMETSLGLRAPLAAKIGAIIVFAANVEFRLERAIWRLQGHRPRGVRHATDAKPIGILFNMFETEVSKLPGGPVKQLAELWCPTARIAFDFRHSIAHGATFWLASGMNIHRNHSWEGEVRQRPGASFWGNQYTFENIYLTFGLLLHVINSFSNSKRPMETIGSPKHLEAMRSAKLLMEEMAAGHGPWIVE